MEPYNKERWRATVENGKIPRSLLAEIVPRTYDLDLDGPAILHPEAADAMSALLAAARDAGHPGLRVKYSYRTLAKQWEKWENYQAGGNLAAYPGTSNHGWAVACDLTWSAPGDIAWAHDNARRFGFLFDVPSENWHITYQGGFKGEPPMTDEQLKQLKDATAALAGVEDFLEGKAEPGGDSPSRARMFRALKRAASQPEVAAPDALPPHNHPHVHHVPGNNTGAEVDVP